MNKDLLSLTEHSLEVSSKLSILDRLDDSLSAIQMVAADDVSTESSSALLRAIGIQSDRHLDKETILRHLDKIQSEVMKDIYFPGSDVTQTISGMILYIQATYRDLNLDLIRLDNKESAEVLYSLAPYDKQTAQVNGRLLDLSQFIKEVKRFNEAFTLITDTLGDRLVALANMGLTTPDPGIGTYVVTHLQNDSRYLNNSRLRYKNDALNGWRFTFDVQRNDIRERKVWSIGHQEQTILRILLGELSQSLEIANQRVNYTATLGKYKSDRQSNKGNLNLVYRFYIPLIITHTKIMYLISDVLKDYLKANQ